mmetsp:Transcript_10619/g.29409  ORF Transcript_10619/g.29409 Transcript_10619/m.29409 type:complete len:981 (-) Transcript_10619:39-2981(-)
MVEDKDQARSSGVELPKVQEKMGSEETAKPIEMSETTEAGEPDTQANAGGKATVEVKGEAKRKAIVAEAEHIDQVAASTNTTEPSVKAAKVAHTSDAVAGDATQAKEIEPEARGTKRPTTTADEIKRARLEPPPPSDDSEMEGEGSTAGHLLKLPAGVATLLLDEGEKLLRYFETCTGAQLQVHAPSSDRVEAVKGPSIGDFVLIEGLRKRPLRRVNGSFGRIVPHGEKAVDVAECVVQLMDGVVITLAMANVSVLDLGPGGEAWAWLFMDRSGATKTHEDQALWFLTLFIATLAWKTVPLVHLPRSDASEDMSVVELPRSSVQSTLEILSTLMQEFGVFAAVAEVEACGVMLTRSFRLLASQLGEVMCSRDPWSGETGAATAASKPDGTACLLLYGQGPARLAAQMKVLALVGSMWPGCFSALESAVDQWTVTTARVRPRKGEDDTCLAQRVARAAASTTASVELVGRHLIFGCGEEQRWSTLSLLELSRVASESGEVDRVPEELEAMCTRLRVPEVAGQFVSNRVVAIGQETGTSSFWVVGEAEQDAEESDDDDQTFTEGMVVQAKFQDEWHDAKVIEVDLEREKVRVEWTFDGSSSLLSTCKVRQQLTEEVLLNQQKRRWLRASWTLALLGPLRSRIVAALRVMGLVEKSCHGLWSVVDEAVGELQSSFAGPLEDVEVRPLNRADSDPLLNAMAQKGGAVVARRAGNAANCVMQVLGAGLFMVGNREERLRSLHYARWLLSEAAGNVAKDDSSMLLRDDVTVIGATSVELSWLEPSALRLVERETQTIAILVDKAGDGTPEKSQVRVYGHDPALRDTATARISKLLDECEEVVAEEVEGEKEGGEVKTAEVTHDEKHIREGGDEPPSSRRIWVGADSLAELLPREASVEQAAASWLSQVSERPARESRPDPRQVLRSLPKWPADIKAWCAVQDQVWAGHVKLGSGWIRVWSRSKDSEYYYRLRDGKSAVNIRDAMLP